LKLLAGNKIIHKVRKHRVPVAGLGKRDNKHKNALRAFLEGKKNRNKLKIAP
jgi:hypothetical protein